MKITKDLDDMTEEELRELHRTVAERINGLIAMRRHSKMMNFRIGDRVTFDTDRGTVVGRVVRVNHKTISVDEDDGHGWRVSPHVLKKIEEAPVSRQPPLFLLDSLDKTQ